VSAFQCSACMPDKNGTPDNVEKHKVNLEYHSSFLITSWIRKKASRRYEGGWEVGVTNPKRIECPAFMPSIAMISLAYNFWLLKTESTIGSSKISFSLSPRKAGTLTCPSSHRLFLISRILAYPGRTGLLLSSWNASTCLNDASTTGSQRIPLDPCFS
jgi:hypothetical protein